MARNALGRGLGALIREPEPTPAPPPQNTTFATAAAAAPAPAITGGPLQIDIDLIDPSPFQPRTPFSETEIEELSQTISTIGIIHAVFFRKMVERNQLIKIRRSL